MITQFLITQIPKKYQKKYAELLDGIKNLIKTVDNKFHEKKKFNSDDNLLLNKTPKLHNLTVVVGYLFEKDGKYILSTSFFG